MFESITAPKSDPILSLIADFQKDTRTEKIDLGIGVYRNDEGITPVMQAVTKAEALLLEQQTTKAYQGLLGDMGFNTQVQTLLLGESSANERAATMQTPGASGALRLLADLIASTQPNATVWISNPSYINHRPIMERAGLNVNFYPYFNEQTKQVDEPAMLASLANLGPNDVVLLHGCCHNPSGADLSFDAWQRITELAQQQGFLPFIDVAYQGLGDGLEDDIRGVRHLTEALDEVLISSSCSKNFGLYRERTGAATVVGKTPTQALNTRTAMCGLARGSYSMPPAHGAGIVNAILSDAALTHKWRTELSDMTARVISLRAALVKAFQEKTQTNRFDYFGQHKGMFSLTGISDDAIHRLKVEHGIYIVAGGRMNIAGLKMAEVDPLVDAFIATGA